ncbi:MAG: TIGR02253 family HAD-type hydrolase [Anaerolineales bacterium]
MSEIRHIIFDLGGTLMRARQDWGPILQRADRALADALRSYNIQLDAQLFRAKLHNYYAQRDENFIETTYHFVLRETLKDLGYEGLPEEVLRAALDALYAVTQSNWELEEDAPAALQSLRAEGYRLGIFSNAGDDKDVQQLITKFGVQTYFDFALTSAACYYRKPHPRAFELSLAHWNIPPQEAAMVGDSLAADIQGARNVGLTTVWISRRAQCAPAEIQRIRPDAEISSLAELMPALAALRR